MNEKKWLETVIKAALEQRHLPNNELTKIIMSFVESYEAMKEI